MGKHPPDQIFRHWEKPVEKIEELSKAKNLPILHLHFNDDELKILNEKILPALGSSHGFYLAYEFQEGSSPDDIFRHRFQFLPFLGSEASFPYNVGIQCERHILSQRKKPHPCD